MEAYQRVFPALMNRDMLVSIALATYNGERFLREQLESIFAQSWPRIEVVAADDRSTDGTVAILEEYRRSHGLRYRVNERNLGFVRNFEQVVSLCTGDCIALADQDDIWEPEKIETLVRAMGDSSLVYSDASLIDGTGNPLPGALLERSGVAPVTGKSFAHLVCNACVTGCTAMFRRDLLDVALPIPAAETYHDWWLSLVASKRDGLSFVDRPLVKYRQHGGNYTGANERTPLLTRLRAHLEGETGGAKREYYGLLLLRTESLLGMGERLGLDGDDLGFLADIHRYAETLLDERFHFETFRLAYRHRQLLFPSAGFLERYIFVFSKLVNKLVTGGNR
jgi:glycosyltransferase involved in cell wall biosynthesis